MSLLFISYTRADESMEHAVDDLHAKILLHNLRESAEQSSEERFQSGKEACLDVDRFDLRLGENLALFRVYRPRLPANE